MYNQKQEEQGREIRTYPMRRSEMMVWVGILILLLAIGWLPIAAFVALHGIALSLAILLLVAFIVRRIIVHYTGYRLKKNKKDQLLRKGQPKEYDDHPYDQGHPPQ